MNGTLKSLLVCVAFWSGGVVAWLALLTVCALAGGKGRGTQLLVAMGAAWLGALGIALAVVVASRQLVWKWMPAGFGRVTLVVGLALAEAFTAAMQAFSVFVVFDR